MFDSLMWVLVFSVNIMCGLSKSPILVGFSLLSLSFFVFLLVVTKYKLWYGLIFFLVYVGAVLVLVFYVVCLSSNPMTNTLKASFIMVSFFLMFMVWLFMDYVGTMKLNFLKGKCSFSLVMVKEKLTQVILFYVLFFLLWFMSKFTYLSVGSVRGFV